MVSSIKTRVLHTFPQQSGAQLGPSPSASDPQPTKEVGRNDASRDTLMSITSISHDTSAASTATASPIGKRQMKRSRIDNDAPSSSHSAHAAMVDLTSVMEDGELTTIIPPVPVATPSTSVSTVRTGASVAPVAASSSPVILARNPDDYVPVYVGHDKLQHIAHIDNSRGTALSVKFMLHSSYPLCPAVDSLHQRYNVQMRHRLVALLLGGKNGFHINAPIIPELLVVKQTAEVLVGRQQSTAAQQKWLAQLTRQTNQHGMLMRDPTGSDAAKSAACGELWALLAELQVQNGVQPAMWDSAQLTSDWSKVLALNSCILGSDSYRPQSLSPSRGWPHHYFQLALHAATPEAAYVIACTMASYSLMRMVATDNTQALAKLLAEHRAALKPDTAATDSSDDEVGWQRQQSGRDRHRTERQQKRAAQDLGNKLAALTASPGMMAADAGYKTITELPLLALATTVTIRAITRPYISCIIDMSIIAGGQSRWTADGLPLRRMMPTSSIRDDAP
jgi:hypothetical protein